MSRHSLLDDIVFKFVFAAPQNERVLRSLVNAILGVTGPNQIAHLDVLNPDLPKGHTGDRGLVLDLKCRDQLGRLYNIEVQLAARVDYIKRSLYYLARLYTNQMVRGDSFRTVQKTVGISLLDYVLFPDLDDLHSRFRLHDERHSRELTDVLEIHYVELAKYKHGRPLRTRFERWLEILKFGDLYESGGQPLPLELLEEEEYGMALESMRRAYADDQIRYEIEAREKAEHQWASDMEDAQDRGVAKGIERGKVEGKVEGKIEVAREMLKAGIDEETVFNCTGLRSVDL